MHSFKNVTASKPLLKIDLDLQEGYNYVKDHCAQTAHQPGQLLKEKDAIH